MFVTNLVCFNKFVLFLPDFVYSPGSSDLADCHYSSLITGIVLLAIGLLYWSINTSGINIRSPTVRSGTYLLS